MFKRQFDPYDAMIHKILCKNQLMKHRNKVKWNGVHQYYSLYLLYIYVQLICIFYYIIENSLTFLPRNLLFLKCRR